MTVAELTSLLSTYPPEALVLVWDSENDIGGPPYIDAAPVGPAEGWKAGHMTGCATGKLAVRLS